MDEEFFLGDSLDSPEFFLGDAGNTAEEIAVEEESKNSPEDSQKYEELVEIYNILQLDEKPPKVSFDEYFKSNADIFVVAGKNYYETMSTQEFADFDAKCDELVAVAHKRWIKIENQHKLEAITDAFGCLKSIFRQPGKTESYIKEIRRTLSNQLFASLKQKIKDGVLEVSEILELIEIATSIHFVTDTANGRKYALNWIKAVNEKYNFTLETYTDTFIKNTESLDVIDRLDTEKIRQSLFRDYKKLADIHYQITEEKHLDDVTLFEQMNTVLAENKLLVSNLDYFFTDFLEPEIERQRGRYNFSAPLNSEYYYYLKGTAINVYQLQEEQWRQLTMLRNIQNEGETTNAFIMGHEKESTIKGIAELLESNSTMAEGRIIAGDLETYLGHVGRRSYALKIAGLKESLKGNSQELVKNVIALLRNEDTYVAKTESEITSQEVTIDTLIEADVSSAELRKFIVNSKGDEALYDELVSDSQTKKKLIKKISGGKKRISYSCFIINVMKELLEENDISQYGFAFEKLGGYISALLAEKNDRLTFETVYSPLVKIAVEKNILSEEFKESFSAAENE